MFSLTLFESGRAAGRRLGLSLMVCLGLVSQTRGQAIELPPAQIVAQVPADAPVVQAIVVSTMDLDACLNMATGQQPALRAARASLAAADSAKRGLDSIIFGQLLSPDLSIRKQQACLGISIAASGLQQAEWETRYAVIRTFYSVQYAKKQQTVVDSVIEKLTLAHEKAVRFVKAGDPNIKVTQIDVDTLALNLEFARGKRVETEIGVQKAMAGLREAIGINLDVPLEIPDVPLPELVSSFDKASLISGALANRAEMAQAYAAAQVSELEICAQKKIFFNPAPKTFAAGGDIHAKPIPQGVANGEYRPAAIGPEMPVYLAGSRQLRVERATDLSARAQAVVDKTHNLITLEVEAAYLKWADAAKRITVFQKTPEAAAKISKSVQGRFDAGNVTGEELLRARTLEDYAKAQYNEALFNHAVALATIERATAGAYRMPSR